MKLRQKIGLGLIGTGLIGLGVEAVRKIRKRRAQRKLDLAQDRIDRAVKNSETEILKIEDISKELEELTKSKLEAYPPKEGESFEEWIERAFEGQIDLDKELEIDP